MSLKMAGTLHIMPRANRARHVVTYQMWLTINQAIRCTVEVSGQVQVNYPRTTGGESAAGLQLPPPSKSEILKTQILQTR